MPLSSPYRRPIPKAARKRLEDEEIEEIINNIDPNSSRFYELGIKILKDFFETVNKGESYYQNLSPEKLKWENEIVWRAIQDTIEAVLKETKGAYVELNKQIEELKNTISMCMMESFKIERTPGKTILVWNDKSTQEINSIDLPVDWSIRKYKLDGITDGMANLYLTTNEDQDLMIPYPVYLKLKKREAIPIEDLKGILKAKDIHRKVLINEKLVWSEIVAKEETKVKEIADNTNLSRETVYKYIRELFLEEDLVLKNGEFIKVHPSVFELTEI